MGTPAMKRIAIIDITSITPVPKSGWSMINPNISISIRRTGMTGFIPLYILFLFSKNLAVHRIMASLAASKGANTKPAS